MSLNDVCDQLGALCTCAHISAHSSIDSVGKGAKSNANTFEASQNNNQRKEIIDFLSTLCDILFWQKSRYERVKRPRLPQHKRH